MSLQRAEWWNKEKAATELSVSTKTVERKAKLLESRLVKRAGRRPERQWRAEDLRRSLAPEQRPEVIQPGADALPRGPRVEPGRLRVAANGGADRDNRDSLYLSNAIAPGEAEQALVQARDMNARHDVAAALLTLTESARRANAPLWLRLDEAAAYSGLSVALIRRLCRDGKLVFVRDRSLKVNRAALDKYGAGGSPLRPGEGGL